MQLVPAEALADVDARVRLHAPGAVDVARAQLRRAQDRFAAADKAAQHFRRRLLHGAPPSFYARSTSTTVSTPSATRKRTSYAPNAMPYTRAGSS